MRLSSTESEGGPKLTSAKAPVRRLPQRARRGLGQNHRVPYEAHPGAPYLSLSAAKTAGVAALLPSEVGECVKAVPGCVYQGYATEKSAIAVHKDL
jgi:hypothetical protein